MLKNKLYINLFLCLIIFLFFINISFATVSNLKSLPEPFAQGAGANGNTNITYDLATKSDITIGIYDDTGSLINLLYSNNQTTGAKSHNWIGVDTNGVEQPAGLYKARLRQRMKLTDNLRIESNQSMSNPQDLAVDKYGNVYVADYGKHSIKKFTKNGTFLWSKGKIGNGGSAGSEPQFYYPRGIAVDSGGFIYVADQGNNRIQKLNSSGNVENSNWGNILASGGYTVGQCVLRGLDCNDTYLYVSWDEDKTNPSRKVWAKELKLSDATVNATLINGTNLAEDDAAGDESISDIAAPRFNVNSGASYILATLPDRIRNHIIYGQTSGIGIIATNGNNIGNFGGMAIGTTFSDSMQIYVTGKKTNYIHRYSWNGGTTITAVEIWGDNEWAAGFSLNEPNGIALDSINRNLWVADSKNNRLVCLNADDGSVRFTVESEKKALANPKDVAVDKYGYLYAADFGNNRIHKFDVNGVEQAGWPKGNKGNGTIEGIEPEFNGPYGLAVDDTGFIYISDQMNGRIIKCDSNGLVIDATWGTNFSLNPANHRLRGMCVYGNFLFVLYDDDPIDQQSQNVWLIRINLNTEVRTTIINSQDWGKDNTNEAAVGEPVVCDIVVNRNGTYAYISNPDMTDNTISNSNSIRKVNLSLTNSYTLFAGGNANQLLNHTIEYTGIAIDEFDVIYTTNADGTGGNVGQYKIWRYYDNNPATLTANAYRVLGDSANTNGYMPFGSGYGSGNGQMGRAEHMVYDKVNQCIWVSDMENNCIIRFDISYDNDGTLENNTLNLTIENPGDTPTVLNYSLYGSNINYLSAENQYYCRAGNNDTVVITFNKTMDTTIIPTVTIVFEDNYETAVVYDSYFTNTYRGKFNIPEGHDGQAFIRIAGAKDTLGAGFAIEPFESAKFIVDTIKPTAPQLNISSPYNVTSNPIFPYVTGSVSDQNPYKVDVITCSDALGNTITHTQTGIEIGVDKTFTATAVYLNSPAPTINYIGAVAVDKAGNRSDTTSPLKIVNFTSGAPGVASISPDPDAGIKLNTKNSFYITYTAAENIIEPCTLTVEVPYGWSAPQNLMATSAGYIKISSDSDGVTNLRLANTSVGDTFFYVLFDAINPGGYFKVIYGDTQNGANANAAALISTSAYLGQNNFTIVRKKQSTTAENIQVNDILVIGEPMRVAFQNIITDTNIYKGQKNIEIASLTFYNDNQSKTSQVTNLTFAIQNILNAGIVPATAINKIIIKDNTANYAIKTAIENSGNIISIALSENILIPPLNSKTISILVDIPAIASAAGFKIAVSDSSYIKAFDAESSGVQIIINAVSGQSFNTMKSEYCLINSVNQATDLNIDFANYSPDKISFGQTNTRLASLQLSNPITASSTVKLKTLKLALTDTSGAAVNFNNLIDRIIVRQTGGSVNYANVTTMPASNSITITLTDLFVSFGDTKNIDIITSFKNTGSASSVKLEISDSGFFSAVDNNLNSNCTVSIIAGSPKTFPLKTAGAILQSPNVIQKIRSGFNTASIFTGGEFSVSIYTKAYFDSANIYALPAASDLKFFINNIDSTAEFSILSTSGAQTIDTATTGNTITYYCKHTGLSAGSLRVDLNSSKFAVYDFNDYFYGGQILILSDSRQYFDTTAALTIISDSIEIQTISLSNTTVYPDSQSILVNQFRIINNQAQTDTLVNLGIKNIANNNFANTVYVYVDNGNGSFDAGDTLLYFADFRANTITALVNSAITASSSNLYFIAVDIAQSITDKDTVDIEIPAENMYFSSGITRGSASVNSSGVLNLNVIADRIIISPTFDTKALGQNSTLYVKAVDAFGNLDKDFNGSITITATDLSAPNAIISAASPGVWDTGDEQASGYLSNGEAVIQIYDVTAVDTVTVTPSSIYFSRHDTAVVYFTNNSSLSANMVTATAAPAATTDILILDFSVSNPAISDTITMVRITGNNTSNTDVLSVKLWIDNGAAGFQGAGVDTLVGQSNFSGNTVAFDTPILEGNGVRLFVTYSLNTTTGDNNILDAYINTNDLVLEAAGALPQSGTVNSSGQSTISITASKLKLTKYSSFSNAGDTLLLVVSATDGYDNIDKNYNSNIISVSNNGSAKYVSTTLTGAAGIPNGPLTGYLTNGEAQIITQNQYAETVTFTAGASGLTSATVSNAWTNILSVNINLLNNLDTNIQIITISGTATGASNGETVVIYVNNIFQSNNYISNNAWSGIAQLTGYADSIVAKAEKNNGGVAYDTRTINYFGASSAKITYPDTFTHDTYIQTIVISGTTANTRAGDTVIIYTNGIYNSEFIIQTLNGSFEGTTLITSYSDSVSIKLTDAFDRFYYDTITVNFAFPNALSCTVFTQGRLNHSCSLTLFSNQDTYIISSVSNGYALFTNINPNTYTLKINLLSYKINYTNNILIDTNAIINLGIKIIEGGDLNQSDAITIDDLGILMYYFGKQVDSPLKGDINNSGWVTEDDYSILIKNLE